MVFGRQALPFGARPIFRSYIKFPGCMLVCVLSCLKLSSLLLRDFGCWDDEETLVYRDLISSSGSINLLGNLSYRGRSGRVPVFFVSKTLTYVCVWVGGGT